MALTTLNHKKVERDGYIKNKEEQEREWRDSELTRTDELVKLPDYPVDLLPYRTELRNYPEQTGFPNGIRPIV